ncbi:MAG TPA: aldo/keto reductase [Gemmatimonadaceae bacterium]|nr:aldo/keto reductase [Gemmatimonadaceae bacterium]
MLFTTLGSTGLTVSRICLGCMSYGSRQWRPWMLERDEAMPFFRRAIEQGINFFDTSDAYSLGVSEEITGQALREYGRLEELVIATKVRYRMGEGPNMAGLSRKHVIQGCEASLRRLGVETIDLYQIHRADARTPMEETLAALDHLVHHGKVRYLGASSMYAWQLMKMLSISERNGWARFVAMQNHYNLLYREEEREMIPLCLDQGLGILPWSPLARGMLTGKRRRGEHTTTPRDQGDAGLADQLYDHPGDWDVVDATVRVAERLGRPPAQVALAWLLARPGVTAPIIGATKLAHLDDAVAALELRLSPEDAAELEASYQPHAVRGWHDGAPGPAPIR